MPVCLPVSILQLLVALAKVLDFGFQVSHVLINKAVPVVLHLGPSVDCDDHGFPHLHKQLPKNNPKVCKNTAAKTHFL